MRRNFRFPHVRPIPGALGIALSLLVCLFAAGRACADNWQASIHENGAPASLVGVDKKRKTFNFYEKNSPLSLRYQYPCVTGQLSGDKQQINDLRTPEGVYFVEYKIASGLDFKEYGGIAYTLNYPNPVDKLRGKTGHGIWIHSKGFGLAPTRGCVAIDLGNIAEVGPRLTPGLPVVVAEELKGISGFDDGIPAQLASLMSSWSKAWAARSPEMFEYYDPDAYSRATENFAAFRLNKERLFKTLSFIKIFNREIHALEGPGYWVTWAEQLYTASNLSTEGIRRLYWQKDKQGRFRIVGMEWIPRDVGMRADFQKGKLVAEGPVQTVQDASSEIPQAPRLDMPEQAEEEPVKMPPAPLPKPQAKASGKPLTASLGALAERLVAVGDPLVPRRQPKNEQPDEIVWGIGRKLTEPQKELPQEEPKAAAPAAPEEPGPAVAKKPAEIPAKPEADSHLDIETARALAQKWRAALAGNDQAITALYNQKEYNRLPAALGIPRPQTLARHLDGLRREIAQPWLEVIAKEPVCSPFSENIVRCETPLLVTGSQLSRQGLQELWIKKDAQGEAAIVGARFTPAALGLEANYLEQVSEKVASLLENWRKAWEGGQLEEYLKCYAPDAWQQGKAGIKSIRSQKELLWSRVRPTLVQLSGLRLSVDPKGIRADMNQVYADSSGKTDKGVKTLLLRFDGKEWRIQREDWAALAP